MTKRNFQWSAVCLLLPDRMQSNANFFFFMYLFYIFLQDLLLFERLANQSGTQTKTKSCYTVVSLVPARRHGAERDKRQNLSPTGSFAQNSSSASLHQEPLFNHIMNKENDFLFPAYNTTAGLFVAIKALSDETELLALKRGLSLRYHRNNSSVSNKDFVQHANANKRGPRWKQSFRLYVFFCSRFFSMFVFFILKFIPVSFSRVSSGLCPTLTDSAAPCCQSKGLSS